MSRGERGRGDKKALLLEAAKRSFLLHGYRRTSVDDVAREAGVAKGTVYLYFKSKEEIFRAVSAALIGKYLEEAERAAASRGTVEERLAAALEAKVLTVHLLKSSSAHGQELVDSSHVVSGDLYAASYGPFVKVLAKILRDVRLSIPATEAAWMVFRAAMSAGFSPEPPPPPAPEVQKRLRALAGVLVRGLRAEGVGAAAGPRVCEPVRSRA